MALLPLAVVMLILLWPLIVPIARFLFVAHAWLVVLFLPAGLLVRYGPSQDMRLFVAVTFVCALALFAFRIRGVDEDQVCVSAHCKLGPYGGAGWGRTGWAPCSSRPGAGGCGCT
jgi:hypothetical protein